MKIREQSDRAAKLNMHSLIDVVFLLLIFFVMTFQFANIEGDFGVKMPLATGPTSPTDLTSRLKLSADETGELISIHLNSQDLGVDFDLLRSKIVEIVAAHQVPAADTDGPEIEIATDYNLRYAHVIDAIIAVSGYKDGNQVVKLIDKISFAKPQR